MLSKINAYLLTIENDQPKVENLEPLTVAGRPTEQEAIKHLKEVYGKTAPVKVGSIEVEECTFEISVSDFIKYATKIDTNK